jgi:hypothetical protein
MPMAARIRRTARAFGLSLALVVAFGYAAGAKPVFASSELRCPAGYTAQPASIISYECRPPIPDRTTIQWPAVVTTQDEVGLYLANPRVRVFDIDFVSGAVEWLAFDVPLPTYGWP